MLLLGVLHAKTLFEAIDPSAAVHQFLFAGVEGVTLGANFNAKFALGGTRLKRFAAYAANDRLTVLGMDFFLHGFHLFTTGL